MTPRRPLPRHRLPADAQVTPRLAAGPFVLCPWQPWGQALDTVALLELELHLVDPDGADCLRTQMYHDKGSLN